MDVKEPSPRYAFKASKALTSNLPVDWQLTRVEDAGAVLGGRQRSPSAQGEPTPYLRVANVFAGWIDTSDVLQMPFTADERARFALRAGDILLNEGQSLELVGRSAIYRDEPPNCCFQNTLVRFRAGPRTDPNYAQYVFESYLRRGEFSKIALQTTSIAHLGAGRFAQMPFVAPPLAEQRAIGQALADADTLIDSLEQLLTKKRQIKQGAMQELLTGKRRLPGFVQPWITRTFADVAAVSRERVNPSALNTPPLCIELEHLEPSAGRLSKEPFESEQAATKSVFRRGDVLFGKLRAYLRKFWFAEVDGVCSTEIWVLRSRGELESNVYLFYTIQRDDFIDAASTAYGTHMPRSDWKIVAEFELTLPSDATEQAAIAQVLSDLDIEIASLEARLTKARALKQAMAQALLTGRIRLVEPTA